MLIFAFLTGVIAGVIILLLIRLSRKRAALENKNHQLTLLYDLARALNGFLDSKDVYHEILATVGCMLDFEKMVLMLRDSQTDQLNIVATYGAENAKDIAGMECSDSSFLSVPLLGPAEDEAIGVLNISRPSGESFHVQERELVSAVSHLIALAIMNSRLYSQVKELSIRDALTKLFNRRHGQETIEHEVKRAQRFNRSLALLLVDIDYFKHFNDRHGHPEGDKILQEFAALLSASIRDVDYVARWGGEEFVVLLPNTDLSGGLKVAEKIRRNVYKHPFPKRRTQPNRHFSVSIGLSVLPDNAEDVETLVLSADAALYDAKEADRNCTVAAEITESKKIVG